MPRKIVFATNNAHKLTEVRQIFGKEYDVVSLAEIGCHEDIPETGDTLEENARQKARYVSEHYGVDCFADDTGLEVAALDMAPGVHSARYAREASSGGDHDSQANMRLLLKNMEGIADRRARFRTVMSFMHADGREAALAFGVVNGRIAEEAAGEGGFGYDPVFIPDGFTRSFAQMTAEEKNAISHRGRAAKNLRYALETENI